MMDAAAAAYVALAADGTDVLLMAADHALRNDHRVEAGEPGRALANGDLLRVEAVTAGGLVVRRALDADPATGRRRWTDHTFVCSLFGDAELGCERRSSSMSSCQSAGPPCSSSSARTCSARLVGRWRSPQLPSCTNTGTSWIAGPVRL
jgi:hypothetical protein